MQSLLSIEWLKIRRYRTFWSLCAFFIILLPLLNYGISGGVLKMGTKDINILSRAYSFNSVWQNFGWWTSLFAVFISVLVIILTTNEYQFRTHRQNVIDGWSRLDFYHAKWHLVLALSVATTVYVLMLGLAFGFYAGGASNFPGQLQYLFYTWILCLNYYGFSLLVALLLKRTGIAIGMFFLYWLIVEAMANKIINYLTESSIGNYLPLQASDELLPFPLLDSVKQMANIKDTTSPMLYVAISLAWIVTYYIAGRQKLLRSDW